MTPLATLERKLLDVVRALRLCREERARVRLAYDSSIRRGGEYDPKMAAKLAQIGKERTRLERELVSADRDLENEELYGLDREPTIQEKHEKFMAQIDERRAEFDRTGQ